MGKRKNVQSMNDRVDTEHLEMRRFSREDIAFMDRVLFSSLDDTKDWKFDPNNMREGIPVGLRIIRKKIIEENLKIEITQRAYFLISLFVKNNPNKAMFVLHKIGNSFEKRKMRKWLVNSVVFDELLFPSGLPTEQAWEKWLKKQKKQIVIRNGQLCNKMDIFPEEWKIKTRRK